MYKPYHDAMWYVAVVCCVCLVVMIMAQAHHDRYNETVAWLPCRYDHEQSQWAAAEYLTQCEAANVTTWIVGAGRLATFRNTLPQWTADLEFAVQESVLPFALPPSCIHIHVNMPKPSRLERCSLGFLRNILREPLRRTLRPRLQIMHVPRRGWLDLLRVPWRHADPYPALVYDDGEIGETHNNDMVVT